MSVFETSLIFGFTIFIGACVGSLINVVIYRLPKILEREWLSECLNFLREYLFAQKKTLQENQSELLQESASETTTELTAELHAQNTDSTLLTNQFPYVYDEKSRHVSELIHQIEAEAQLGNNMPVFNLSMPRSHCPACHAAIPWYRNIPLLTWLMQLGRAHCCGKKISSRYFWVEAAGAALATIAIANFGLNLQGLAAAVFLLLLLALAGIDWETQLLPDQLTLPLLWLGLVVNVALPISFFALPGSAVIGAVGGYLGLWFLFKAHYAITKREGLGYGDFKLTAAFGAWFGWQALPLILVMAALLGILIAILSMRVRDNPRHETISFGPWLCVGAAVYLFYGQKLMVFLGY